ncbi:MAG: YggU family protein [Acidobacteriaceae bacterium]|nr:YggU family protein [Acidobacteriaceae bacterium]
MIPLHETPAGVTIAVKIQPRAKKNALIGVVGDALKLALTAPPVDGRANQACVEFFSDLLHLPRSSITIVSGQTSRRKVIRVAEVSMELVKTTLESLVSSDK